MTPTKDQQAQEYANSFIGSTEKAIRKSAWLDGYTACEQSMWRSVEEEKPPIGELILCRDSLDTALVYYDGEDMYEPAYPSRNVRMPFWMPIPSLPATNTEKK